MRIVSFVDLDDTFLLTADKRPAGETATPAAVDSRGRVLSFTTAKQAQVLAALGTISEVVPATGRSLEALRRVALHFGSFAITHHGAVVTEPGGAYHAPWADAVYPRLRRRREQLEEAVARMAEWCRELDLSVRLRLLEERGVPTYVSAKGSSAAEIVRLAERLEAPRLGAGLRVHRNGRNLALLPEEACKRKAVLHVAEELRWRYRGDVVTLGFGDSWSDAPFLGECDFAAMPRGSQIARTLLGHEGGAP